MGYGRTAPNALFPHLLSVKTLPSLFSQSNRIRNPFLIQPSGNMGFRNALCRHFKNPSDYGPCFTVNCQFLFFCFLISIRGKGRDKLPLPGLYPAHADDLLRQIFTIQVICQIFKCRIHKFTVCTAYITVIPVIYRYKSNAKKWKYLFQIITHFDIISSKPGKILHKNTGYGSLLHQRQKVLYLRTFKISSAVSIVTKLHQSVFRQFFLSLHIRFQQFSLCRYAVAFIQIPVPVLIRKPQIQSRYFLCHPLPPSVSFPSGIRIRMTLEPLFSGSCSHTIPELLLFSHTRP